MPILDRPPMSSNSRRLAGRAGRTGVDVWLMALNKIHAIGRVGRLTQAVSLST